MTGRLGLLGGALLICAAIGVASQARAQGCTGNQVFFSGQQGVIVDQFGLPDFSQDCVVRAFDTTTAQAPGNGPQNTLLGGTLCLQGSGGTADPLRANICNGGMATGEWDVGNGMAVVRLTSSFGNVAIKAHDDPKPPSECPVDNFDQQGAGAGNNVHPVEVRSAIVCEDGEKIGSVALCNDAGPAFIAEAEDMSMVLKRAVPSSNMGIDFLCQNARMRGENGSPIIVNLCFPIREDGTADVGNGIIPVVIPLNDLPPCGRATAPTMTEWGLVALVLCLLAAGTLLLRWRERSAPALPTP